MFTQWKTYNKIETDEFEFSRHIDDQASFEESQIAGLAHFVDHVLSHWL